MKRLWSADILNIGYYDNNTIYSHTFWSQTAVDQLIDAINDPTILYKIYTTEQYLEDKSKRVPPRIGVYGASFDVVPTMPRDVKREHATKFDISTISSNELVTCVNKLIRLVDPTYFICYSLLIFEYIYDCVTASPKHEFVVGHHVIHNIEPRLDVDQLRKRFETYPMLVECDTMLKGTTYSRKMRELQPKIKQIRLFTIKNNAVVYTSTIDTSKIHFCDVGASTRGLLYSGFYDGSFNYIGSDVYFRVNDGVYELMSRNEDLVETVEISAGETIETMHVIV
jgi:hypothetical protein